MCSKHINRQVRWIERVSSDQVRFGFSPICLLTGLQYNQSLNFNSHVSASPPAKQIKSNQIKGNKTTGSVV